ADDCDNAETCDGTSSACPSDGFKPASTVCRASAGACDPAESCPGTGPSCPSDAKRTGVCRAAAGVCDVPESCDGVSNNCPADQKSTAVCRPATGTCDVAESCDGVSNNCPADAHQPDGTTCSDGNSCTTGDNCQNGTCVATPNADGCADDFLCYKVKSVTPFTLIPNVLLSDTFVPAGHYDLKKVKHLCAPVSQSGGAVPNSDAYLVCYRAKPAKGVAKHVPVTPVYVNNELGPETLKTLKEDELCIPSVRTP